MACTLENGFAAALDVPGLNYRTHKYHEAYDSASSACCAGVGDGIGGKVRVEYTKWPVEDFRQRYVSRPSKPMPMRLNHVRGPIFPEVDFALADDFPWTMGQFVWTGFDYLGEPSPYNTDAWPSH